MSDSKQATSECDSDSSLVYEPDFGTPFLSLGVSGISSWLAWRTKVLWEAGESSLPDLQGGQAYATNMSHSAVLLLFAFVWLFALILAAVCYFGPGRHDGHAMLRWLRFLSLAMLIPGAWQLCMIFVTWLG